MIPYVKTIAATYNSEILLLHVVDPVYGIPATGISPPVLFPLPDWLIAQRTERLDDFCRKELASFPVRQLLYEGEPEAQIVATAQGEQAQLVIMPTHGYGRFRRFLIGSVTSKVLHDLECPVLTGAHFKESDVDADVKISNVACAIDLGPCSFDVLTWASRLASDFHSTLSIVHVASSVDGNLRDVPSSELQEQLAASIRDEIGKLETTTATRNVTVCIEKGEVAHKICSYAKSVGANLLVIGRGANTEGLGRLRTNAYGIIRQSSCPVLSV